MLLTQDTAYKNLLIVSKVKAYSVHHSRRVLLLIENGQFLALTRGIFRLTFMRCRLESTKSPELARAVGHPTIDHFQTCTLQMNMWGRLTKTKPSLFKMVIECRPTFRLDGQDTSIQPRLIDHRHPGAPRLRIHLQNKEEGIHFWKSWRLTLHKKRINEFPVTKRSTMHQLWLKEFQSVKYQGTCNIDPLTPCQPDWRYIQKTHTQAKIWTTTS